METGRRKSMTSLTENTNSTVALTIQRQRKFKPRPTAQAQLKPVLHEEASEIKLLSTCVSIPHPDKVYKKGEDAVFLMNKAIGVFDGVGSWSRQNIDAGKYSKGLAKKVEEIIEQNENKNANNRSRRIMSGKSILFEAVKKVNIKGSSTALISILNKNNRLNICNVGDGMVTIIRRNKIIFSNKTQQHSFNTPYQLGYHDYHDLFLGSVDNIPVQHGDIIIMASDGLWDNLHKSTLLWLVSEHMRRWKFIKSRTSALAYKPNINPLQNGIFSTNEQIDIDPNDVEFSKENLNALAFDIAKRACKTANQEDALSPFAENARRMGIYSISGGKLDDITVIVSAVLHSKSFYQSLYYTTCCQDKK